MECINLLNIFLFVLSVLCILELTNSAPLNADSLTDDSHERFKRFAIPWLNNEHNINTRGKSKNEDTPEFYEDVASNFFDLDGKYSNQDDDVDEQNYHEKRGKKNKNKTPSQSKSSVSAVKKFTVYLKDKTAFTESIEALCLHGHNIFRKKHMDTPPVKYNKKMAEDAEEYSMKLARENKFEHDRSISGKYGENLYRMDNTYNLVATAIHAIMAWYEESWITLKGVREPYNYSWNPSSIAEFSNKGVGHFTQFVWDKSVQIGCGAATTVYYDSNNRKWTRTVFTTRYEDAGNLLGSFPKHIKKLKAKVGSLENIKRGKLYPVEKKKKNNPDCVNTVPPAECANWKKYNWCDRTWAKRDCLCTCE